MKENKKRHREDPKHSRAGDISKPTRPGALQGQEGSPKKVRLEHIESNSGAEVQSPQKKSKVNSANRSNDIKTEPENIDVQNVASAVSDAATDKLNKSAKKNLKNMKQSSKN